MCGSLVTSAGLPELDNLFNHFFRAEEVAMWRAPASIWEVENTFHIEVVSVFDSAGSSPSHTSAALFLRGPSRCRSRQLYATFVFPPRNQPIFAVSKSQSLTRSHFRNQWIRSACSAQNASGSARERA